RQRSNLMIIVEANIVSPSGRTYFSCPAIDDVDIREGGSNRAPGQVSDASKRQRYPQNLMPAPYEPGVGYASAGKKESKSAVFSTDPATAYAETQAMNAKRSMQIERGERVSALPAKERMERLAQNARMNTVSKSRDGWTVAQEEIVAGAGASAKDSGGDAAEIIK